MREFGGPDFEMTYPCFILMVEEDVPVIVGGDEPIIFLFTDFDLLGRFEFRRRPEDISGGTIHVEAADFPSQPLLLEWLEDRLCEFTSHGVKRVAIDATLGRYTLTATLDDFVAMLRRRGDL